MRSSFATSYTNRRAVSSLDDGVGDNSECALDFGARLRETNTNIYLAVEESDDVVMVKLGQLLKRESETGHYYLATFINIILLLFYSLRFFSASYDLLGVVGVRLDFLLIFFSHTIRPTIGQLVPQFINFLFYVF